MDNDYIKMGERILIYPNDRVIYDNKEIDTGLFIKFINGLANSGYVITFYEALSGFAISNQKNDDFYLLEFSKFDIENYKIGVYTPLTSELRKLLLLQEQKNINQKNIIQKKKLKKQKEFSF